MAKSDGMNRADRESFWRGRIAACAASGLSAVRYCRESGISLSGYRWWQRELRRRDGMKNVPALFTELRPVPYVAAVPPPIEIVLPGDRVVRVCAGFDESTLARVVRMLEGLGC